MASLRDIRNRINSVDNTKQVTRAMKMVAAAKLRRAQERIFQTRPYSYKLADLIDHLQSRVDPTSHPLFGEREEKQGVLIVVVTADRGLAGAFNANAIKLAEQTIQEEYGEAYRRGEVYLACVGRKGYQHFSKRDYQVIGDFSGVFDDLNVGVAHEVTDLAVDGYSEGRWDEVRVVYNEFKNTISQNRIVEPLLPIPAERFLTPVMEEELNGTGVEPASDDDVDYLFEPDPESILNTLVPRYVTFQLWRALLESNAAEQGARMIAMDNATSNAEELLDDLKLAYNRARQDAITTEIIEITSGAEALEAD